MLGFKSDIFGSGVYFCFGYSSILFVEPMVNGGFLGRHFGFVRFRNDGCLFRHFLGLWVDVYLEVSRWALVIKWCTYLFQHRLILMERGFCSVLKYLFPHGF
uniref:Uncharacterized protein n=1 Tax=Meloidogyne enterolobii TaxID=390850 RepID=A0A6V7XQH1_MELEN|nr:unnamed protein product [Meloidogyne enterolobii]